MNSIITFAILARACLVICLTHSSACLNSSVSNSMFVNSITSFGILDVIDGFKCNKSCGDDGFQSNLIKDNYTMLLCEPLV